MKSRVSSATVGNNYEARVRAWRLAAFVDAHMSRHPRRPFAIGFQFHDLVPWDDIVETPEDSGALAAWQVKHLEHPLADNHLREMLLALVSNPKIKGTLAIGGAVLPGRRINLIKVDNLGRASHATAGRLDRMLSLSQIEDDTLTAVASLIDTSKELAFRLLSRFTVLPIHGPADVRHLTTSALHAHYANPDRVADELLAYTLDEFHCGLQITMEALENGPLGQAERRRRPWRPPAPTTDPRDEILYWHADERGVGRTFWLSPTTPGAVAAEIPGIVLGVDNDIMRWVSSRVVVPTFLGDLFSDHRHVEPRVRLIEIPDAHIYRNSDGVRIEAGSITVDSVTEFDAWLSQNIEHRGNADNILLWSTHVAGYSGGAHSWWNTRFWALDLGSLERFEIFSAEEAQRTIDKLGDQALFKLRRHLQADVFSTTPTVTAARIVHRDDGVASLKVQLTFEVCHADADNLWDDESASIEVDCEELPRSLRHIERAPAVLSQYWKHHPMFRPSGWTRVPRSGPARQKLEEWVQESMLGRERG